MKSSARWTALLLLFIMILSQGAVWAEGEVPPVVDVLRYEPNLRLSTRFRTPALEAGKEIRLAIPMDNIGRGEARNIQVTLGVDDPASFPFEIDRAVLRRSVSSINGQDRGDAPFYLTVRTNVATGLYPVPFQVEYTGTDPDSRYSFSDTVYVKVENSLELPRLIIEKTEIPNSQLQSGTVGVVRVWVKNAGDLALNTLQINLEGFGSNGLYLENTQRLRQVATLEPGESSHIDIPIRVETGLEEGRYAFQMKFNARDNYGKTYESAEDIYVPVAGTRFAAGLLAIENLRVPNGSVSPYSDFNVTLQVRNLSSSLVEDILVNANGGEALLPKTPALQQIKTLSPGEAREVSFTFFAKDGIEAKNYPLEIRVEPLKNDNSNDAVVQFAGVLVGNTGASSGTPKIIIDQYRIPTEYVEAGSSFPLTISFFNTHTGEAVRNIRISLTSEGDVFSPVDSSNTFFIQRIAPNSRVERGIILRPRPDAGYKIHNLYADIEYEDNSGTAYTTREIIGVPVIQEARLVFGEVETGMEAFVGNPLPVSLEFYNAGRGKIRNLVVSIEGDFDTSDGALYIGNMDGGASNYYDATIIPTEMGEMSGKVVFRFDDEIDQQHVVEKTFDINVMEMMGPPEDFFNEEPTMNQSGRGKLPWIIGGVVAAAAIAGGLWFRRRRKKKLEEVEDDE
ncbi:MAG: hypothetical protein SCM88_06625 [Bacillota bacterium]|nr:hypothetical protein [Bacillota bacterium]